MAMLAGPRRKQKVINLRAKNNEWSNDTNKFGQRMLEKMGWSSGKGLGANENGMVEHVVARYKNDDRGLGFEDRNDQWTKHEDDFNSLLANLSNGDNNEEKLHSGVSLEVKSKKSKARVHYHKFTRGKDLTRYSEKDLANIFGKKSLKNNEKPALAIENDIEEAEKKFTEKGSMEDYFKSKMEALKSRNMAPIVNEKKDYEETDFGFTGFSGTTNDDDPENSPHGFGFQSFSFYNTSENAPKDNEIVENPTDDVEKPKKKKKKKKSKPQDVEPVLENEKDNSEDFSAKEEHSELNENLQLHTESEPSKKSKKKKYLCEDPEEPVKKKKSKNKALESQEIHAEEVITEADHEPKKKKKRKNKDA